MVSSGPISLAGNATSGGLNESVDVELGLSSTATISFNDAAARGLAAVPSGQISLSNFYGKSHTITINLTINSPVSNYTIFSAAGSPSAPAIVTITNNSVVTSTSTAIPAMQTGTGWHAGSTITIINNGYIAGRGGAGGNGGGYAAFGNVTAAHGGAGGGGGLGLYLQYPVTLNNTSGYLYGGGGGGGGGAGVRYASYISSSGSTIYPYYPGGGGGGGAGGGTPGLTYTTNAAAGTNAAIGHVGTTTGTGGAGGNGANTLPGYGVPGGGGGGGTFLAVGGNGATDNRAITGGGGGGGGGAAPGGTDGPGGNNSGPPGITGNPGGAAGAAGASLQKNGNALIITGGGARIYGTQLA